MPVAGQKDNQDNNCNDEQASRFQAVDMGLGKGFFRICVRPVLRLSWVHAAILALKTTVRL
jgi:hypothetical protein